MDNAADFKQRSVINSVRKAALSVLQEIGPKQSDNIYEACLKIEMSNQGISFIKTGNLPFFYKGVRLDDVRYKSALIVEGILMVQIMGLYDEGLTPEVVLGIRQDLSFCSLAQGAVVDFHAANKNDIIHEINTNS